MREPPKCVTKVLIGNGIKHPNWIWTLIIPFAWLGTAIYVIIGLPIIGIIGGWLIARDEIMGKSEKESPTREQINNACLAYRHDFGLMEESQADILRREAAQWYRAWQKSES